MPQILQTTVYKYSELADAAKAKARDWFTADNDNDGWGGFLIEEWRDEILPALGFEDAEISYSGFYSQGDGASFVCSVDIVKYCEAFKVPLRPMVAKLISDGKIDVSVWISPNGLRNLYSHENTVLVEYDIQGLSPDTWPLLWAHIEAVCQTVQANARLTMRKLYKALEDAYDYEMGEGNVGRILEDNDYLFTEQGQYFTFQS